MARNLNAQRASHRIAEEVRVWMTRRRVTQATLAKRLNLSQAAVSRRLTGAVSFDVDQLEQVAQLLEVDLAELMSPPPRLSTRTQDEVPA